MQNSAFKTLTLIAKKNFKKKLKEIIQNNDISKNEIISKEHNKLNGTQFLTEDEVIKRYREILSKLQS